MTEKSQTAVVTVRKERAASPVGAGDPRLVPSVVPAKTPKRYYRPELDSLRFFAFLAVFLFHVTPRDPSAYSRHSFLPHAVVPWICGIAGAGAFGVDLFFALSAYLITTLLLREKAERGHIDVKAFYARRILRIWPLYFLFIAIAAAIPLWDHTQKLGWPYVAGYLLLAGNWVYALKGLPASVAIPLWSISIEEQFYLLVPWSIKYFSRRLLIAFACSLLVLANICLYFIGRLHISGLAVWYNSLVQFEFFAAGMLLCLMLRGRIPRMTEGARLTLAAAFITCWYFSSKLALTPRSVGDANAGSWPLIFGFGLAALGCCFLLLALLGLEKTQLPRSAIYLGRISYGLYVFHLPVLHLLSHNISIHRFIFKGENWFFNGLVGLGLTIVVASISYRFFEAPFLRLKNRYQTIESRPV